MSDEQTLPSDGNPGDIIADADRHAYVRWNDAWIPWPEMTDLLALAPNVPSKDLINHVLSGG